MNDLFNKVALGTAQFGLNYGVNNQAGQPAQSVAHEILEGCLKEGILYLDTAEAYGNSQEVLGEFVKNNSNAERFSICSKFKVSSPQFDIKSNLNQSLDKLGTNLLDCYYFHSFGDFEKCNFFDQLVELKQKGLIKNIGASVYTPEEAITALQKVEIDQIQLPFNVLDNYGRWNETFKESSNRKKIIHTRSVFLQGLFFKSISDFKTDVPHLLGLLPAVQSIHDIAKSEDLSVSQLCLYYALQTAEIDKVLIGLETMAQFNVNSETLRKFRRLKSYDAISEIRVADTALINPANWPLLKEKK